MHRSGRRVIVVALVVTAGLSPVSAPASQPAPPLRSCSVLSVHNSPGESLMRLWAWVACLLPGHRADPSPAGTHPAAGSSGPGVRPDDGSAPDPNG